MLERLGLTIEVERVGPAGRIRPIRDAATLEVIGQANRPAASAWWRPAAVSVFEGQDGSLLLTVRRGWLLGSADVADADGRLVALIRGRWLEGLDGRPLAGRARGDGVYRLSNGVEVATISRRGEVTDVRFHQRVAGEPLLKMALLAAALQ